LEKIVSTLVHFDDYLLQHITEAHDALKPEPEVIATSEVNIHLKKLEVHHPGVMESLAKTALASGERRYKERNYSAYKQVVTLNRMGESLYSISRRLRIPYSTCYAYVQMDPERVELLKARHDAED
jgi:hypothetical protein